MCGIFGLVTSGRRVDVDAGLRGIEALRHRGPDGLGVTVARLGGGASFRREPDAGALREAHAAPDVFLGHRRLSIIDLAPSAFQPMSNEDGRVWVCFNGEIYNHEALRAELVARGHRFATDHSDTEVLAHGYEEWGDGLVDRLRGMFAFVVVDLAARRALVARDPFGEKPLYYLADGRGFAFASELKALLAAGLVDRRIDPAALADYLALGYVPAPSAIYRGVRKLPSAHRMRIDLDAPERATPERYFQLRFDPAPDRDAARFRDELDAAIAESVKARMLSDVPLGAYLSGGLDSTTVVRAMAAQSPSPPRTFNIAFGHAAFDESPHAERAARRYGAVHRSRRVDPADLLAMLPRLATIFDEPFADSSALPSLALAEMTRGEVTVALSGDGGDELLGGYTRYALNVALGRVFDHLPGRALSRLLAPVRARFPTRVRGSGLVALCHAGGLERYEQLMGDGRLARASRVADAPGRFAMRRVWDEEAPALLHRMRKADVELYIPEDLATKVDRTAMAVGLEVRAPLLDRGLYELVARAPVGLWFDGRHGKLPLRAALARDLGEAFVARPKQGFGVPLGAWFRRELRDRIGELARGGFVPTLFPAGHVERLVADHLRGSRDQSHWLFSLLTLEEWHRTWGGSL